MNRIDHYARNTEGRDIAVGDIHGHFTRLAQALQAIAFDPLKGDRLFSVGDLVDRGPESSSAGKWLCLPWFKAVRGNHEEMAIQWATDQAEPEMYQQNGGGWNIQSDPLNWTARAMVFAQLPIAIEVETAQGLVGIVHAECPCDSWRDFKDRLAAPPHPQFGHEVANCATWGRARADRQRIGDVAGVRAVVVGHTPFDRAHVLDNHIFIDTCGWMRGHFTLLDLATLQPAVAR